jgi:hypothetical protein
MVPLISFILFIKYTIPKNQKGKGYVFKDFTLDSVQIKKDPAQSEDKNDSTCTISQSLNTYITNTTSMQMTTSNKSSCIK